MDDFKLLSPEEKRLSELGFPFSQMVVSKQSSSHFHFPSSFILFLYSDYGHLVCKASFLLITLCCGEMKRV